MKRSAKPNTTCSGGFAAPSVAAYKPQTVPERPATAAPPQKSVFFQQQNPGAGPGGGKCRRDPCRAAADHQNIGVES